MIEAKELRVGNWVLMQNEKGEYWPMPIEDGCEITSNKYKPIPLTSEILESWCGFSYTSKGFFIHPNWYNISLKYRSGTYDLRCNFMERIATNIDYLHQLQNLYCAVTQTELEVKL